MNRSLKSKYSPGVVLTLLALLLFFILLRWNSFNSPFFGDEAAYAYSARLLSQKIVPYKNTFEVKPPMIIYTYLLAQLIDPNAYWPPRLLAALFTLGTTLLVGYVARRELGPGRGLAAMWVVTPMLAFPYFLPFAANTEIFMLFPLMGVLSLYVWRRAEAGIWCWFFAGFLGALALWYKPIALLVLLFIFGVWLVETWQHHRNLILLIRVAFFSFLGVSLASFLVLLPILAYGAWDSFWESVVVYNSFDVSAADYGAGRALFFLKLFWRIWPLVCGLTVFFIFSLPKRWWFFLGLFLAALPPIYQVGAGHYYLLLVPFWGLILVVSLELLIRIVDKEENKRSQLFRSLAILILVLSMVWPTRKQFTKSPEQLIWWMYGTANSLVESPIVAQRITELTSAKDYVYVLGTEPQIFYYAQRHHASRFFTTFPLTVDHPKRLTYQEEVIDELQERLPTVIVISQIHFTNTWDREKPQPLLDYLNKLLSDNFQLVGGYVRDKVPIIGSPGENKIPGSWKEPLSENQKEEVSLLVYKRK